jgi:hypothetical protein
MIFLVWILVGLMLSYWMIVVYAAFRKPTQEEQRLVRALSRDEIEKVIDRTFPAEQQQVVERLIDTVEQDAPEDIQKMSGAEALNAPYLTVNFPYLPCLRAATSLFRIPALRNLSAESTVLLNRCSKT